MKIKKAKKDDLKVIAKLFLEESGKKPYVQGYTLRTANLRVKDMFNFGSIYVASVDLKIAGFLSIAGEGKEDIYVDEFWIKKEFQRKGMGKGLLDFVTKKYLKRGAKTISVMTSRKAGALKFYEKFGFKENGEEVILKKNLI
jgi:ribosomal protein S18 acetylase RimI-like enzyme